MPTETACCLAGLPTIRLLDCHHQSKDLHGSVGIQKPELCTGQIFFIIPKYKYSRNMHRTTTRAAYPQIYIPAMSPIDIFQPSGPTITQLDPIFSVSAESGPDTGAHTSTQLLPPTYSAEPREGEQIVYCDRLPPYQQVVRLHRRSYFAWMLGLRRLRRSPPHAPIDDIELAEMAILYSHRAEEVGSSSRLVVSGCQLVSALLFALMVGIAISKPI